MYICISVVVVSLILRALASRKAEESRVISTWDIIGGEFVEFTPDEMAWRYGR